MLPFVLAAATALLAFALFLLAFGLPFTLAVGLLGAAVYFGALRPWHLRWGASTAEVEGPWPGDDLAPGARSVTHAITVHAPPEAVWPWLVQLGQGRGGFYSYDVFENLAGARVRSADRVVPELQSLAVGDLVPFTPRGEGMRVAILERPRTLVLGAAMALPGSAEDEGSVVWGFHLREAPDGATRLVARLRLPDPLRRPVSPLAALYYVLLLEPAHFVMERKMLHGIRGRVEGSWSRLRAA